jgi:hypothetical protein
MQMRRRDHAQAHPDNPLLFFTVNELMDDQLPPTPEGFFG